MTELADAPAHTVRIEVELGRALHPRQVTVLVKWLGEDRALVLRDDGVIRDRDIAGDGVFVGELRGDPTLLLPLEISAPAPVIAPWRGVVRLFGPEDTLRFVASPEGHLARALARPAGALLDPELPPLVAGFGWAALVLLYVGLLAFSPRRAP